MYICSVFMYIKFVWDIPLVFDNPYKLTYSYLYVSEVRVTAVTTRYVDCCLKAVTLDA